jgi:peptidyl-tRNA hydrolase, PTH1 family
MKLIVGLGNPGKKYERTRHNVGFMVIDALKNSKTLKLQNSKQTQNQKFKFEKRFNAEILKVGEIILAKPQTFMNDSGDAVSAIVNFYKIDSTDLYIIHDDLDIKLGEYKIQKGKGPKQHNGILSVEEKLGRSDFWRIRVGIENREAENRISGEVYTLQDFTIDESNILSKVLEDISTKIQKIVL